MSTARIPLKQGNRTYRFLRFETSGDGSLVVFLDRDARSKRGSMTASKSGQFIPDERASDKALPSGKFTIHTTGEVHYYSAGDRKGTIHIEPLHALTKRASVGFVSIPRVSRLDPFVENDHSYDAGAIFDVPEEVVDRLTFYLEIGPNPQMPETYGVALNYELYSSVVRLTQDSLPFSDELVDHFIYGIPNLGQFERRQIDKATAELGFHQRIHGRKVIVYREAGGAYVLLTVVPMRTVPHLEIGFDKKDLRIEVLPFEGNVSHKVRFWICDKGGRNKKDDLRQHIQSIQLDAEL